MVEFFGHECMVEKIGKGKEVCYRLVSFENEQPIANVNIPNVGHESESIIAINDDGKNGKIFNLLQKKGIVKSLLGFKKVGKVSVPVVLIDQNRLIHL